MTVTLTTREGKAEGLMLFLLFDIKVFKADLKPISRRGCGINSYHEFRLVGQMPLSNKHKVFPIQTAVRFYASPSSFRSNPDALGILIERNNGPIGEITGNDGAGLLFLIEILDAALEPCVGVQPHHKTSLIIKILVVCRELDGCHKIPLNFTIIKGSIVLDEAMHSDAPVIRLAGDMDNELFIDAFKLWGFMMPLHCCCLKFFRDDCSDSDYLETTTMVLA